MFDQRRCKRLRLRSKTPPAPQQPLVGQLPDFAAWEQINARKSMYLITFPHPSQEYASCGVRLVAPESKPKDEILQCLLEACELPVYDMCLRARVAGTKVTLALASVFREAHKPTADGEVHFHDHVPVVATKDGKFYYLPVKKALLYRFGLASHWSCRHDGYWSALRYCAVGTPDKPYACLDHSPVLWARTGSHPKVSESVHEPLTANATAARRAAVEREAADQGLQAPKVTDLDIYPIIVQKGFRNTDDYPHAHLDVIAYVKKHCSTAIQGYVWKHRARLSALINDVWQWETVDDTLATAKMSRLGALQQAAASPCTCGGAWLNAVVGSFVANAIDVRALCKDIVASLTVGRSETLPVPVLAGAMGGEGKSLLLKALASVYGAQHLLQIPEKTNFPLMGLEEGPKVAFLDEWRFVNKSVGFATQCLWFDGSAVPVARPQNGLQKGHFMYRGSAPILVTGKLEDVENLAKHAAIDLATGRPASAEASMLHRRLKVYKYTQRIPKPPSTSYCGRCFAELVLSQSSM